MWMIHQALKGIRLVLKVFEPASRSPGGLVKTLISEPRPLVADSVGLGQGLQIRW